MIVESGFRGCDNKGRHGPELGQVVWNPQAGVGGAFMLAIPNVLNNPPICYIASHGQSVRATHHQSRHLHHHYGFKCFDRWPQCRPALAPFHRISRANPTYRGPGSACNLATASGPGCVPAQGGDSAAGGCQYPSPTPAVANLIGSVNNQSNGGFAWACDGALAMVDPVYVDKGPKQPNILQLYPMSNPAGGYQVASANRMTVLSMRTTRSRRFWLLARTFRAQ